MEPMLQCQFWGLISLNFLCRKVYTAARLQVRTMKCLALICLQLALLHDHVVCGIPREMYNAKYDGFVDDQIVPEQESLVNRNTDNLGSVERISNDEDDENDDNDFSSYVSNLNNGGNSYSYSSSSSNGQTIVNGIDSSVSNCIYDMVDFDVKNS